MKQSTIKLVREIGLLTSKIKRDHPQLYVHLDENPATLNQDEESFHASLKDYKDTLTELITHSYDHHTSGLSEAESSSSF